MRLSEMQKGKNRNLHFIRFFAALMVIYGHSFLIATGSSQNEPFIEITKGALSMGSFAVSIFFLFGGFLIAKSMERLKTAKFFFKARIKRIFPSLIFVNIMVMILGVFFSKYSPIQYFSKIGTWKYLLNCFFVLVHDLPGVFITNPYSSTVNGSLWTLPVEFLCYIFCFFIYKIKCMTKKGFLFSFPFVIIGIGVISHFYKFFPILKSMTRPCILFYIGIGYWVYKEYIELNVYYMIIAGIGFVLTIICGITELGMIIFFPYFMFVLCFGIKQVPICLGKLGNYSYGIYLWGFPIQQAITTCLGEEITPYIDAIMSIPIAVFLGIITYILTEKNNYKK